MEKDVQRNSGKGSKKTVSSTQSEKSGTGIKKAYLKKSDNCNVTFVLPKEAARGAARVAIVGEFNNWDINATPMEKSKTGDFSATLTLRAGKEYRFKYLIDNAIWENDWNADRYAPNAYGTDDSVVVI
jgi:1,4-alpha-glucan branching enzyme